MANTQDILDACNRQAQRSFSGAAAERTARDTAVYLAHTQAGESLRAIASAAGSHPSTVMRAVRRVETRRDDPLFDRLIEEVEAVHAPDAEHDDASTADSADAEAPGTGDRAADAAVTRIARSVLRRLSEPGAFLLVAPDAAQGGVFCGANGHRKPIALIAVAAAAEFVRRDWIAVVARGASSVRYRITPAGRAALRRILAEDQERRGPEGFDEAQTPFAAQHALPGARCLADPESGRVAPMPVNLAECPLGWLARRRGPDGAPFLDAEAVEAGERLRADFEAAQMGPRVAQDWSRFLTPGDPGCAGPGRTPCDGPAGARDRVAAALACLGPGLADVALRVCCFLEGIESCERRFGWSARSGKVVLKLALQRLAEHYGLSRFRH